MGQITEASSEKFLQLPKWRIRYHEAGEGDPVILLHGSGPGASAWSNFSQNIEVLARKYRVIALDFPGWGRSDEFDPQTAHRFAVNAEVVVGLMNALDISRAALVGNSMGGIASQMVTALHPGRVTHCVTMGAPAPGGPQPFYQPSGLTEGLRILFEAYRTPSEENVRRLVEIMVFDSAFASDALIRQRTENALANPNHLSNFLKGLATMHIDAVGQDEIVHALEKSPVPALIMHGRDDRVVPVEHSLRTAALMPNASLLVFNRCGHWAQLEHAGRFNALLDGFLSDASA
ncbi:alpha/beta hydrolase [Rhizorhapis sp.]|uniref:alpha/beta fold hydrolase n=1 Tax=Rhizorhapis sp. TaxID=1968842 RepID=UPI002B4958A7|nr:alpha/beta hydrolase [Rhizorhapis sp.]HKR16034.1 alpha/beta hydrolase [Rhizorhapis sp.]